MNAGHDQRTVRATMFGQLPLQPARECVDENGCHKLGIYSLNVLA